MLEEAIKLKKGAFEVWLTESPKSCDCELKVWVLEDFMVAALRNILANCKITQGMGKRNQLNTQGVFSGKADSDCCELFKVTESTPKPDQYMLG